MVTVMADTTIKPSADDGEVWLRRYALSEEYIIEHCPDNRGSAYRWFETPNVVDLVPILRRRDLARTANYP